jgi:uncharacterized protein YegP (UPF0339 family)
MTRAEQVSHAVSALRKARAAPSSVSEPASMTFLIDEDNGGAYHWTIVTDDSDEILVRSAGFGSYEQAQQAAGIVHHGNLRALFARRSDVPPPVDLPARPDAATARDGSDAERWLDEGGSFSREAGTR